MTANILRICSALLLMTMAPIRLFPEEGAPQQKALPLDKKFFSEFQRTAPILRDDFLESRMNSIVLVRGLVTSIQKTTRLKKKYRVILTDPEAERLNVKIVYHVYIDSAVSISMLSENRNLEFSGQLIAYTPINSKRDSYILDILFEKGAVIIE
ncbi:MAG: hypothetical protein KA369_01795 [Spirochaetes bacterium]|nr:hypothetical protein [Spirochaetota bacterium]